MPDRDAFGNEVGGSAPPKWTPTPTPTHDPTPAAPPTAAPPPAALSGNVARSGMATVAPTPARATWALIIGVISLFSFWFTSPVAWSMGKRAVAEIDASNGRLGGRSIANAGRILGIVGTLLLVVIGGLAALGFILEGTGYHSH
jgi:Domain of unknown function (DUF4190)